MSTYKNLLKTGKPSSGPYTYEDLRRLFKVLQEINSEVQKYEFEDVFQYLKEKNPELQETELKKEIAENLIIRVGIYGEDGFYKVTSDERELGKDTLPKKLTKITFENTLWYKTVASREPNNTFQVTLDFNPPPTWDLIGSPSNSSSNQSSIQVLGKESTWVEGSFNRINSIFTPGWSLRSFINASGAYDLLIWLIIVPATTTYFVSLERHNKLPLQNVSVSLMTVAYFVAVLFVLFIFRILFNVIRSGYPILEYEENETKGWTLQRVFRWSLGVATSAIVGRIAVEATLFIAKSFFGK